MRVENPQLQTRCENSLPNGLKRDPVEGVIRDRERFHWIAVHQMPEGNNDFRACSNIGIYDEEWKIENVIGNRKSKLAHHRCKKPHVIVNLHSYPGRRFSMFNIRESHPENHLHKEEF